MAILGFITPPPEDLSSEQIATAAAAGNTQSSSINVDAWTVSVLQSLSISPGARGTGTPLAIPIDGHHVVVAGNPRTPGGGGGGGGGAQNDVMTMGAAAAAAAGAKIVRPLSQRDSQRRREALLVGKEGSRQRRRWENDHLMHVPNVQPPEPIDWQVHPTHPTFHVPYQLAHFWDGNGGLRQRAQDKTLKLQAERKRQQRQSGSATGLGIGEVPRDLREATKRSPVVRSWVKVLEGPVREFLVREQQRRRRGCRAAQRDEEDEEEDDDGEYVQDEDSAADEMDSEDEEIVFVGRNGAMRELREMKAGYRPARREISQQTVDSGVVFDSFGDDESAAYKRWLAHTISDYYGLASRSVTLQSTSQRVVYVGLNPTSKPPKTTTTTTTQLVSLPRPLWELC